MKPTYNAISPEGQKPFCITFDTFGFFARSIEDLQLLADAYHLTDDEPPAPMPVKGSKIAFIKTPLWPAAGLGTVDAMQKAFSIFERHGVGIEHVDLPAEFGDGPHLTRLFRIIARTSSRVAYLKEYLQDKTKLDPELHDAVANKNIPSNKIAVQALDEFAKIRSYFGEIALKYDVIITPSAVDEAPLGLNYTGDWTFNFLWTVNAHSPVLDRLN
jgi:Asp-tRNA(Asn)/Glu-tRNA(Gln) amidotransferase A subunit family amidase